MRWVSWYWWSPPTHFDGGGSENWILPTELGGMAVIGVLVGLVIPDLTVPRLRDGGPAGS